MKKYWINQYFFTKKNFFIYNKLEIKFRRDMSMKKEALVKVEIVNEMGDNVHIRLGGKILAIKKEEKIEINQEK